MVAILERMVGASDNDITANILLNWFQIWLEEKLGLVAEENKKLLRQLLSFTQGRNYVDKLIYVGKVVKNKRVLLVELMQNDGKSSRVKRIFVKK